MSVRLFIAFATVDTLPGPFDPSDAQALMMRKALTLNSENMPAGFNFAEYIQSNDYDENDPCTWTGVECHNSVVRVFLMTAVTSKSRGLNKWYLRMCWLPGSIRELHLASICFSREFRADWLPRELRYLNISDCRVMGEDIDFSRLPQNLEYLSINEKENIFGPVDIISLPLTMKFIRLIGRTMGKCRIDSGCLPEGLELLELCPMSGTVDITDLSGNPAMDERISSRYTMSVEPEKALKHIEKIKWLQKAKVQ